MLNERLYKAISAVFREEPHIINEGAPAEIRFPPPIISYVPVVTPIRTQSITGGEQYAVNCPFCGDKRHRLYFSHMWNVKLYQGDLTYQCSDRLVRCFNEECQRDKAHREWWTNALNTLLEDPVQLDAATVTTASADNDLSILAEQVPMVPGLLDILDPRVPDYVRHYWFDVRKFTKETLDHFGVKIAYMPHPIQMNAPLMRQPVAIIPVYQYDNYWFYQARLIPVNGDPRLGYEKNEIGDEYPKYYIPHGAKKSWSLYNLDHAESYEEVAIVEGPTDVWRVGDRAMAKFGRSLSAAQRGILMKRFRNKTIILVPDQDDPLAMEEAVRDKIILENNGDFKAVEIARLPAGKDPGDLEGGPNEVWTQIYTSIDLPDTISSSRFGSLTGL